MTDKSVLAKHVERMLQNDKSRRFVEKFTYQWLHTAELDNVVVDNIHYGSFREELKDFPAVASSLNRIAQVYTLSGDYEQALSAGVQTPAPPAIPTMAAVVVGWGQ